MRILLLYPPTQKSLPSILPGEVESARGAFPPLGILYLAGALKNLEEVELMVIDAPNQGLNSEEIAKLILEKGIELLGITVLSFHLLDAMEVAQKVKQISPKTKIIAGGAHPHIYPKETLELGVFDYVGLGEGEQSFLEMVKQWQTGNFNGEVKGIISREQKNSFQAEVSVISDLDSLNFPARELLRIRDYYSVLSPNKPATTAISSRGCPYQCLFCDRPHLGKRFRARSAGNVFEEMALCQELGIKEVIFYDDNFTSSRARVLTLAELLIERKLKIAWDIRARVGDLKSEDYQLLKRAGLARIHFGVESGEQKLLDFIQKGITIEQAKTAFSSARKAGIETLAYFMLGLPLEDRDTLEKTIRLAQELKPDYVHFSLLTLFPATRIYQLALEKGIIKRDVWREFAQAPGTDFIPPIWEEKINREELLKALTRAYRKFYFQPNYLFRRMVRTKGWAGFKRQIKMGFSIIGLGR